METSFTRTVLGKTGLRAHRLGLSASYRPGRDTVRFAVDRGINLFFGYGFDTQMTSVLRDLFKSGRERYILVTGAYNLILGYPNLRRTLEKRLRQFGTDYIDLFLFLGVMKEREFAERTRHELHRLKETGKVKWVGISTHERKFAGRLVADDALDVVMMRYNAAHRGAEIDIFPFLAQSNPGVIGYTATRWTSLTRRPKNWPPERPLPPPAWAYRFVLSNPHVHVCLTAPRSRQQLEENLRGLEEGPLDDEEMRLMREYGDAVYRSRKRTTQRLDPQHPR